MLAFDALIGSRMLRSLSDNGSALFNQEHNDYLPDSLCGVCFFLDCSWDSFQILFWTIEVNTDVIAVLRNQRARSATTNCLESRKMVGQQVNKCFLYMLDRMMVCNFLIIKNCGGKTSRSTSQSWIRLTRVNCVFFNGRTGRSTRVVKRHFLLGLEMPERHCDIKPCGMLVARTSAQVLY